MSSKSKKPYDDDLDDGETIADMNVDGMPWYIRRKYKKDAAPPEDGSEPEPLSKEQMRAYRWAAVKAGLLIVLVFAVVYFLFIAFCDFVWFK